jgi:hypothetical protein
MNNGILLCSYCHKFAPDSPHQGSLEFILWLMKNKKEQYDYLMEKLEELQLVLADFQPHIIHL